MAPRNLKTTCIFCGVFSAVTAAVMIPFSIFVVAPHVAQHILDGTAIALPNLTQLACAGGPPPSTSKNHTQLFNAVELKVPGFGPIKLGTTILPFTQEVYTTGCIDPMMGLTGGYACDNPTEYKIGSYASPLMQVNTDTTNFVNFSAVLSDNATVALNVWTLAFSLNPVRKARLILKAHDVSVKVMGVTMNGLTLHNELTCTAHCPASAWGLDCPSKPISNSVCYPDDPEHQPDSSPALHVVCESGAQSIRPPTTSSQPTLAAHSTADTASGFRVPSGFVSV